MRTLGVAPKKRRRYKATTNSNHGLPVAENLLQREFTVSAPDHIWVGDITYVSIGDRFGYLATVLDLFSRRIVGWAFDIHMESDLVVKAFGMAERARRPLKGLIFHSDRGSQYASELFRNKLKEAGGIQSMSRKGDCWDNAVAESFFHTIKNEYLCYQKFESSFIAELKILDYIAWYNRVRIHGTCGGVSPVQYENAKLLCA
jgi:transposase InsO family protein